MERWESVDADPNNHTKGSTFMESGRVSLQAMAACAGKMTEAVTDGKQRSTSTTNLINLDDHWRGGRGGGGAPQTCGAGALE